MYIPSKEEFWRGVKQYEIQEKRDAIYMVASYLVEHFWRNFTGMAYGLGVLLLIWNQSFYRYGLLDFERLESCIVSNFQIIEEYKSKNIIDLSNYDRNIVENLFNQFNKALARIDEDNKITKSPVSVAKALHLLAPNFFPLWDREIALAYGYNYYNQPDRKYLSFSEDMSKFARIILTFEVNSTDRTILKLIDQYNYSKYTKNWI